MHTILNFIIKFKCYLHSNDSGNTVTVPLVTTARFICSKEIKSVSGNQAAEDISIGRAIATKIASYFKFKSGKWNMGGKKYAKK